MRHSTDAGSQSARQFGGEQPAGDGGARTVRGIAGPYRAPAKLVRTLSWRPWTAWSRRIAGDCGPRLSSISSR